MIPQSIIINGNIWIIEEKKEIIWNGSTCWGLCCFDSKTISIKSGLSKKSKMVTAIHEIFHAMSYEFKMKFPRRKEEKMADKFSIELFELFNIKFKK